MPQIKRARAATGSSEASLRASKKRNRPRKSKPESDDDMIVEKTPTPKPIPKGGVREVEEKDSSSSEEKDPSDSKEKDESDSDEDSDSPGGLLTCLEDMEVEKAKPKGNTDSPSEGPPSSDEMVEDVEESVPIKPLAESKSKDGDEAAKTYVLPVRTDKGKGKAVKKPEPDDRTTGSSMHAPKNAPADAKAKAKKPIASSSRTPATAGSSRFASKASYSQILMSPPKKMDLAAKILARKNIAVPKEPEISSEQPWRKAKMLPSAVVHFDYQAPYRYMREKPTDEVLGKPNIIWVIPYGAYRCTEERLRMVLDAVNFLAPEASAPDVVFRTISGFYLLQFQDEQVIETLLETHAVLNFRRHTAVFFYEFHRVPRVKSAIIAKSMLAKDMRTLEEALGDSVDDLLVQKLAEQPGFAKFVPKITSKTFERGKRREIRIYRAILDFSDGINRPETETQAIDALWAWDRFWSPENIPGLEVELDEDPLGRTFRFLLQSLCAFCHSDVHVREHCEWAKRYPALKPWVEVEAETQVEAETEAMEE